MTRSTTSSFIPLYLPLTGDKYWSRSRFWVPTIQLGTVPLDSTSLAILVAYGNDLTVLKSSFNEIIILDMSRK